MKKILSLAAICVITIVSISLIKYIENSERKGGEGTGMFLYMSMKRKYKLTVAKNRMKLWHI